MPHLFLLEEHLSGLLLEEDPLKLEEGYLEDGWWGETKPWLGVWEFWNEMHIKAWVVFDNTVF